MIQKVIFLFSLLSNIVVFGQFQVDVSESRIAVLGHSSLHDWTLKVNMSQLRLKKVVCLENQLTHISVAFPIKGMVPPKKGMKKKILKVLQSKTYPMISIRLEDFYFKNDSVYTDNALYTVAGITKKKSFKAAYMLAKNNGFRLSGSQEIKFSDFDMKPPSAMLGLVITRNELLVNFDLYFFLEN